MVFKFGEGMSKGCSASANSFYTVVSGIIAEVLSRARAVLSGWPRS